MEAYGLGSLVRNRHVLMHIGYLQSFKTSVLQPTSVELFKAV